MWWYAYAPALSGADARNAAIARRATRVSTSALRHPHRAGRGVERSEHLDARAVERRALARGERHSARGAERSARVALHAADQHLEVEVRPRAEPRRADVRHGLADLDARSRADPLGEPAQVSIARNVAIAMPQFEHVAVSSGPARPDNCCIADRAHRSAGRRGVVRSLVRLPPAEDRVVPVAEGARAAAELQRRAQELRTQRLAVRVEVARGRLLALEAEGGGLAAGQVERRGQHAVHARRTVGSDVALDEGAEAVPVLEIAAHVDLVLEDV